jgi:L-idonate 5-dehydrogenase
MLAAVLHAKHDLRIDMLEDLPLAPNEVRVAVAFGGICGSDLHYYHNGAVGDFTVREPMTLGHEISGWVVEVGAAVTGLSPGTKAALDPSKPCHHCQFCIGGRSNLCENMRFLGSAARFPHVQGGFAQHLILREDQVIAVPENTDLLKLSCAEPLSIALHAANRAGPLLGKRVLVTGSGPIGLLTAKVALLAGTLEVVITDMEDAPLQIAREKVGVHRTINVRTQSEVMAGFEENGGYFDVAFEASGAPQALASLFKMLKRGARIVQVGIMPPGSTSLPLNLLQSREIDLVGSFRANHEFPLSVKMIVEGAIDVTPILSETFSLADSDLAFAVAGDRKKTIKVHLAIAEPAAHGG